MKKYRIYMDESGNSDLESSNDPNHRFLCLAGVIVDLEYIKEILHPDLENLKTRYFKAHPDEPIVLHRKEVMKGTPPFHSLKDILIRKRFDEELLNLMINWEYVVVSVCIDKKKHKESYGEWCCDPYHYCLKVILERYVRFLERHGHRGDAMIEARGGKENKRLKNEFSNLWMNGTDYISTERIQKALTSKELKFKSKKDNIAGLQLCDLIAQPSRTEILSKRKLAKEPQRFSGEVVRILQNKYDRVGSNIYGRKFLG